MSIEKLSHGVLRVQTPLGSRYFRPSFVQRVYLLWVFRNFPTLPAKVLTSRQAKVIDTICAQEKFIPPLAQDLPLLGTLEQRPQLPAQKLPPRRPSANVSDPGPRFANFRQRL